ncbi:MAG: glutathione-disulfide reductase [Gammaproteobacteria bacterium]|nr:glutathione-disulfide reductase [Gammaproteobacteria bacterium]
MMKYQYDLFVIGAGSGGVRAARMSAGFGAKVAIAEDRYLGGTCVNVGCVPKKLLVYASHFGEEFETARGFGWKVGNIRFDWRHLIENKNTEIKRLNGVYQKVLDSNGVTTIIGRATLVDNNTVRINGEDITAERILISTGGWPSVPDFPGKEHVITSNEAFFLDTLPDRIIIVGGGYIAVEFAGIFHGMGVDTTLVYRGPLFLRGFDHDLREILSEEMRKKGIKLEFNTNIKGIDKNDDGYTAHLTNQQSLFTDLIMYATGRRPNTSNIGLEKTDVKLNDDGAIVVNDKYQSTDPSIYAIGDVTDRINLTPVAIAEGIALAKSLFGNQPAKVDYSGIPTCIFSQPNLGTVGLTEEEAREKYGEIEIYKTRFTPMKLSLTDSNEKTFMKLIVDRKSDRVVGAHMIGPDAGEIIQGIAIAIKAGATKAIFDATIGIHPTAAEEFVTMRESVGE